MTAPHFTTDPLADSWQQEGAAHFRIGEAFFRASSRTGRDLAVLAAIAYKTHYGHLRVLDAMSGCGIRPLRYSLEADADYVWANEGNWDLHDCLQANLTHSLPPDRYQLTHQDANAVFFDCYQRRDFYDLIDIDSFGSPTPTLSTALWAVKLGGLLYLTSTDGRATSGRAPDRCLQTYGAYARSHPAVHEQGLRLLLGAVMQQAAAKGLVAQPVFSFHQGEVNRAMVQISRQGAWQSAHYGFLAYCHACGHFQTVAWKKLGRVSCGCCASSTPVVSGPMWLGRLHDQDYLATMRQIAAQQQALAKTSRGKIATQSQSWEKCQKLIETMQAEAVLPPYYYSLAEIGRRGKIDIPPLEILLTSLRQQGFTAVRTHIDAQAIKTNAPMAACIQIATQVP